MNKFFKSIAIIASSFILFVGNVYSKEEILGIDPGSYTADYINKQNQTIAKGGARIKITSEQKNSFLFEAFKDQSCAQQGLITFSQKRVSSGQLIFELKSNKKECPTTFLLVKKIKNGFTTNAAQMSSDGTYVSTTNLTGNWAKD